MSRKTILILVAIILVALGVWAYFSLHNAAPSSDGTTPNTIGSLFPFGNGSANIPAGGGPGDGTNGGSTTPPPAATASGRLVQVTKQYVAGFTVLPASAGTATVDINDASGTQQAASSTPILRFAERGTGYIYDVNAVGKNIAKTSGTVVAHALIALFGDDGKTVVMRYVKNDNATVATYLGHLVPSNDPNSYGTTVGSFLADNISDMTLSNDKKNLLYLLPTANGVAGMTMKTDGSGAKQVFSSSFGEWLVDWPATGPVVTTKASADVPGYAYGVTSAGVLSKILGGVDGLTTKESPDGKNILYSVSNQGRIDLHIKQIKTGKDFDTGLGTLPEKCAWNTAGTSIYCGAGTSVTAGQYPDTWYQGVTHFNDALWKIDASTGLTTELDDGEGNFLDATALALDANEHYLFFVNKNDASLWSFDLTASATQAPALPSVQ